MTIAMPDSITPGNMPLGYAAYLGYVDGRWPTADRLPALFPRAKHLTLTVTGATDNADGCDQETGDLTPNSAAMWLKRQLLSGRKRPVLYASRDSVPATLAILAPLGVGRADLRILSAHYGIGEHVCSPLACDAPFTADGSQWCDDFPGVSGSKVDMSALADDFFGPPAEWVFSAVRWLKIISVGPHSVKLSWSSPGTPEAEAVHHYQVTIRHEGQDVATYPRDVPKGANPETWQGGSLQPGTVYQVLVRALAVDGHASPWAAVDFRTPA